MSVETTERWWFCPDCGLRDTHRHEVSTHDECAECGLDCWAESMLREMLAKSGRHIVTEAEKRVLDAMAEIPEESMGWAQAISHSLDAALDAELSRRTP